MANIAAPDDFPSGIYQYADGDELQGGPDSSEVLPFKQLTSRSIYQRLRSVTPWDAALASGFGYPDKACVEYGGVSWRSKVAGNAVVPGTDAAKWERWGYSEGELAAYLRSGLLSPTTCPATGPASPPSAASPYTLWKSLAPYAEYWMWMGDAWGVVWARYGSYYNNGASGTYVAVGSKAFNQLTIHRDGVVMVTASARMVAAASNNTLDISVDLAGVSVVSDAIIASVVGQGMYTSASIELPVTTGQILRVSSYSNYAGTAFFRASAYFTR